MYGQVFCRVGARTRAADLDGSPSSLTVGEVKARLLGAPIAALPRASELSLVHEGRWLCDEWTVGEASVRPGATLTLGCRVRGGGGDGGATGAESRSCYLEMYANGGGTGWSRKKESLGGFVKYSAQSTVSDRDEAEEDLARWFNCALTEEPLEEGDGAIVIDRLGSLYNKEGVLKCLRDKAVEGTPMPMRVEHITGMKALVTLKFHPNPSRASKKTGSKDAAGKGVDSKNFRLAAEARFACPLTGLDFNGRTKFFALAPSGLVVSDRALREAKAAVEEMAGGKLADMTQIAVNPKGDELEALKEALEEEKEKKAAKKAKKDAKNGVVAATENGEDRADGFKVELIRGSGIMSDTKRKFNGCDDLSNEQLRVQARRWRAVDHAPAGVNKEVYASLFVGTDAEKRKDETYGSRNARRAW